MTTNNKHQRPIRYLAGILLLALLQACSTLPVEQGPSSTGGVDSTYPDTPSPLSSAAPNTYSTPSSDNTPEPITDLWERIRRGYQLAEYFDHPTVAARIDDYAGNQRFFDLIGERAAPFLYAIVERLEAEGLPLELALLPIVESTYDPNAYSAEHAVGLWQFLGSTGRSFGLHQDWWYDGRRDPLASTEAAIAYLKLLHGQFQEDWLLALAAYNTGSPNMRRAIRRSGISLQDGVEFWDLGLAQETRAHVPKLLALAKIIQDPQAYAIELPAIANAQQLARVEIGAQIDLRQAAELAGISYQDLRRLNSGYRQWATHPDSPQALYVPVANAAQLSAAIAEIPRDQLLTWDRYEIQAGDTLSTIARRLGTETEVLRVVNKLSGSRIIAGRSLLIPRGLNGDQNVSELAALVPEPSLPATIPASYRVRSGDNLWSIARRFQLKSADIAAHNGFATSDLLMPGQILDFSFVAPSSLAESEAPLSSLSGEYRVRPGDTMARIAARLSVPVADLLSWNNLSANETIYPEQRIRTQPPGSR